MKVLITGSTGFVGKHLCQLLTSKNHEVYALARSASKFNKNKVQGKLITGNLENVDQWIKKLPDDLNAVIHTAAVVHANNEKDFYKTNVNGTRNLVRNLSKKFSQLTFIHLSSQAACGPSLDKAIDEKVTLNPVGAYGISKLEAEKMVSAYQHKNWKVVKIRPPMVMGPGDTGMLEVFQTIKKGFTIAPGLNGNSKKFSFVGVYDLINFIYKVLINPRKNEIYHVAYPEIITYKTLVNEISMAINNKKVKSIPIPSTFLKAIKLTLPLIQSLPVAKKLTATKIEEVLSPNWTIDSSKSINDFNQNYRWNLKDLAKVTANDYKKRGWL